MMKTRLMMLALVGWFATVGWSQSLRQVEYFLDGDPGYGLAKRITNVHVGGNELTFDLSKSKDGAHVLYVRTQDDAGHWSATMSRPLYIERNPDIVRIEYFFDGKDPGIGKAKTLALPDMEYKGRLDFSTDLDIAGLALGEHTLTVRAMNRFEEWTNEMTRPFTIVPKGGDTPDPPTPPLPGGDLARIEYFFDQDPGYGKGRPLERPHTGTNTYLMSFADIEPGAHVLYLRAADTNNNWSAVMARPIYVMSKAQGGITALEYFFDNNDPGVGRAKAVALSGDMSTPFAFDADISGLAAGAHQFCVRARDDRGQWSTIHSQPFLLTNNSSGVTTITWEMPIGMKAKDGMLVLNSKDNAGRGDCRVEVFAASGVSLASATWPATTSDTSLHVNAPRGSIIVVKVIDATNGQQLLRRLLMN